MISSQAEYDAVKTHLKDHQGFVSTKGNSFVLIAPNGMQVDILPFGEIQENGSVKISGIGLTNIQVSGFHEVLKLGTEHVELDTGNYFKVATLPAIALLKFIAFDDRPEMRQKDARDVANLIIHFFYLNTDLIYENHDDLFGEEEISLENISSIVIGREMKRIATGNEQLCERLIRILVDHINGYEKSTFLQQMSFETKREVDEMRTYLTSILSGMK